MGFRAEAGRRPLPERQAHPFECGQLGAAAFAGGEVRGECCPLDSVDPAFIAIKIRDDRLFPIARVLTDVFSHNVSAVFANSRLSTESP